MGKSKRSKNRNKPFINLTERKQKMLTHSAKLTSTVNPNGFETTAVFEWGTDISLSNAETLPVIPVGTVPVDVEFVLENLEAETEYFAKIVATNEKGEVESEVVSFITLSDVEGGAPIVTPVIVLDIT